MQFIEGVSVGRMIVGVLVGTGVDVEVGITVGENVIVGVELTAGTGLLPCR